MCPSWQRASHTHCYIRAILFTECSGGGREAPAHAQADGDVGGSGRGGAGRSTGRNPRTLRPGPDEGGGRCLRGGLGRDPGDRHRQDRGPAQGRRDRSGTQEFLGRRPAVLDPGPAGRGDPRGRHRRPDHREQERRRRRPDGADPRPGDEQCGGALVLQRAPLDRDHRLRRQGHEDPLLHRLGGAEPHQEPDHDGGALPPGVLDGLRP